MEWMFLLPTSMQCFPLIRGVIGAIPCVLHLVSPHQMINNKWISNISHAGDTVYTLIYTSVFIQPATSRFQRLGDSIKELDNLNYCHGAMLLQFSSFRHLILITFSSLFIIWTILSLTFSFKVEATTRKGKNLFQMTRKTKWHISVVYPKDHRGEQCNATIVTAYFQINSKHSHQEYLGWMSNMLTFSDCLVVFTESHLIRFSETQIYLKFYKLHTFVVQYESWDHIPTQQNLFPWH